MIIAIWVCCVLMAAGLIAYSIINPTFSAIYVLIAAICIYLGYFMTSRANAEFEYINTNGEIDIDRIINGKKRQTMATFNCNSIADIEKYDAKKHIANKSNPNLYFGCTPKEDSLVLTVRKAKGGTYRVVLDLNDDFKNSMKRYLSYELKNKL
jgi:hypothetical protein